MSAVGGVSSVRADRSRNVDRIGFIGTGMMGRPMIAKLLQAGYSVNVYDIDPAAATDVLKKGARWHNAPRDAARDCGIVITCLPLPRDVFDNMVGERGALAGMPPESIWIDTSTTDYHNTLEIARLAAAIGVHSLEAPVSNLSHMGVDFANVSFFVGGSSEAYVRCEAVLQIMGAVSFHVGDIGQGQSVKLLTNLLFYTAAVASGNALCRSVRAGVPAQQAWRNFAGSSANSVAIEQFAPFLLDGSYDRSCTLEITVKDMGLTVQLANQLRVGLPLGRAVEKRFSLAGRKFDRYDSHLRVIELAEVVFGVRLQVPGYHAPSKYGANPTHPPDQEFLTDPVGRIKPKLEHVFPLDDIPLSGIQIRLLKSLVGELTQVNRLILDEAFDLGRGMGLSDPLIHEVITWSVGASAWSDSQNGQYDNKQLVYPAVALAKPTTIPNLICPCTEEPVMNTRDQQTTLEQAARKRIKDSHDLDGDVDRLTRFYRGWASSYELDVGQDRYCGPMIVAELAGTVQTAYLANERAAIAILDAGCGTGLVGVELERLGFRLIDGIDLSEAMAEQARQTGVYRDVQGDVDLNGPLPEYSSATYDITVCCGVFTLGHIRPDALRELARVTRPNGFVIVSTRKSYAEATSFEDEVRRLQDAGVLVTAHCLKDGRYIAEEDAHYWVFKVTDKANAPTEEQL
ncbi:MULTISPECIES: NAD(P)-binding domain-containing protein [unclassified Mesorhizobium]|uniref:NAD(P)-binding domain-containing protein n=1 Tax=unclassified Mesorhizobium TaxID=325217 RepID=UPI0003CEBC3F|nr:MULTISPECIES: NAD(P)-binding domain-containing protein [unclassified Mesorhizobium]ESY10761.1 6-phosphogluconate dehydrogenase [Mesorhizobium sp. LNJC395A00]WJI74794.1 NAD(P)-binding domain-containing protein [Mesorhizobium sp. C395A]